MLSQLPFSARHVTWALPIRHKGHEAVVALVAAETQLSMTSEAENLKAVSCALVPVGLPWSSASPRLGCASEPVLPVLELI